MSEEKRAGSQSIKKDLWAKLMHDVYDKKQRVASENGEAPRDDRNPTGDQPPESHLLFVGDKEAGRSSIISSFLNPTKEERPKPTVALEYMFARRSTASGAKEIAHIWDLGGGPKMGELIRVPITAATLPYFSFMIVLDLSKPNNIMSSVLYWIWLIRTRVNECLDEIRKTNPDLAEVLVAEAKSRYPKDHPDRRLVNPLPVNIAIVGNKYDQFKELDGVKRKLVSQALRYVAHAYGTHVIFASNKDKTTKDQLRSLLNGLLFRVPARKTTETNGEKAIIVFAGSDTFEAISKTPIPGFDAKDLGNTVSDKSFDVWKQVFEKFFGPPVAEDLSNGKEKFELDAEAIVDEAREQRDEVLHKYRKEADRKAKLESMEKKPERKTVAQEKEQPSGQASTSSSSGTRRSSLTKSGSSKRISAK